MFHLLHTILTEENSGVLIRYEIYAKKQNIGIYGNISEETCRVIYSKFDEKIQVFKIIDSDVNLHFLFERCKPHSDSWFYDGPDKVNIQMIINYLTNNQ
ncbi:hypothetical protein [Enterobacteriaceae bacterium NFIX31]|jgi:hypothetical protein